MDTENAAPPEPTSVEPEAKKVSKPRAKKTAEPTETVEQLVERYNEMVATAIDLKIKGVAVVTAFKDVTTGVQACERLHAQIEKARKGESKVKTSKKAKAKFSGKKKSASNGATKVAKCGRGPRMKWEDDTKVI